MNAVYGRELTFVIRGDIISNTGYAHAARALAATLAEISPIYGLSIHVDPNDCSEPFPVPIIGMDDVAALAESTFLVVIHHTTPDHFLPVLDAVNVGVFYWETTTIPFKFLWVEHIAAMDAIWAPTSFVRDFVRSTGYGGLLAVVPWPHDFVSIRSRSSDRSLLENIKAVRFDRMPGADDEAGYLAPLTSILDENRLTFLSVQSLSPRKGLPILISDWCRFVAEAPGNNVLILKLNFRHVHGLGADHRRYFWSALAQLGMRSGQKINLALLGADLPRSSLQALLGASSCVVSTTYGEGFGGPLVEALVEDTPVICPIHTGIADLYPSDYELRVEHEPTTVQLRGLPEVYPSSCTWNVPVTGSLTGVLHRFSRMRPDEIASVKRSGWQTAKGFCSLEATRAAMLTAVSQLMNRH